MRDVVLAVVTRGDGTALLLREPPGVLSGLWALPGGAVEAGESLEEGLRRELREETALELERARFVGRYEVSYRDGNAWRLHVFRVDALGVVSAERGSEARWLAPRGAEVHPTVRRIAADLGMSDEDAGAALEDAGIAMRRAEL